MSNEAPSCASPLLAFAFDGITLSPPLVAAALSVCPLLAAWLYRHDVLMKLIAPCRMFKIRTYVYSLDEASLLDEAQLLVKYLELMHQF
jgi:hypothetical protein